VPTANLEQQAGGSSRRAPRLELAALIGGALLALFVLHSRFVGQAIAFEDLALGEDTVSYFAQVDGDPIHCIDLGDADPCLRGYERRGRRPVILWLGNSQLHAVNQLEPGQETAAPHLFRRFAAEGTDFVTFSQPNANLQEHLVLFTWLSERMDLRGLVLPLVFDDTRETGLRSTVSRALLDSGVVARLQNSEIGRAIVASNRKQSGNEDLAALAGTVQERTESALVGWLDEHWSLWAQRPQVRGTLLNDLFRLRNVAFGITSTSTRRTIPGRLAQNLAAARALLEDARSRGIATVVYVAPLRGDVPPPYVGEEYAAFRRDAALLAAETGARFADLDALVPAEAWGTTKASGLDGEAEIDFMHFRAEGHALLADAVEKLLREALGGST
jgi:hypothetical protein